MKNQLSELQLITLRNLDQQGGWASARDLNVGLSTLRALLRRGLIDKHAAQLTRWDRWDATWHINEAGKKALEGGKV
jgi:hypothetical protein